MSEQEWPIVLELSCKHFRLLLGVGAESSEVGLPAICPACGKMKHITRVGTVTTRD